MNDLQYKYKAIDGKLEIPVGVTIIDENAIDWSGVKELVIPESVQTIAPKAFQACYELEKITLPVRFVDSFDRVFSDNREIKEIIFIGVAANVDFSSWSWGIGYTESIYAKIFKFHKPEIYIEGEISRLQVGAKFGGMNYNNGQYKFYINNFIENVEVEGTDKWTDEDLFFRAPQCRENILDGNLVNLTLAPRSTFTNDKRWSAPITINASAVTYVYPIEIPHYGTDKPAGCRLLLMGNRLENIPVEEFCKREMYPFIDVWEDYELVINVLKNAGWVNYYHMETNQEKNMKIFAYLIKRNIPDYKAEAYKNFNADLKRLWNRKKYAGNLFTSLKDTYGQKELNRQMIIDLFKEGNYYDGFLCAMVWGNIGAYNIKWFNSVFGGNNQQKVENVVALLKQNDLKGAYKSLSKGGDNKIDGVDEAFFTKLLYFAGAAIPGKNPIQPLIFDSIMKDVYARLLKFIIGGELLQDPYERYLDYCEKMEYLRRLLDLPTSGHVEALLFRP